MEVWGTLGIDNFDVMLVQMHGGKIVLRMRRSVLLMFILDNDAKSQNEFLNMMYT